MFSIHLLLSPSNSRKWRKGNKSIPVSDSDATTITNFLGLSITKGRKIRMLGKDKSILH